MKAVVVGSANVDVIVGVDQLPAPGATVLGDPPIRLGGGKGANQAVALARLGVDTILVAGLGADAEGDHLREDLRTDGVEVLPASSSADHPTGLALITVDRAGESTIVVAPGANGHLLPSDLPDFEGVDVVVLSLEVPMVTVVAAAAAARAARALVVLNAAPAMLLPDGLLTLVSCLVVNESEAAFLARSGGDATEDAARLATMGPDRIVVTLGARGCVVVPAPGASPEPVPTSQPTVVDAVGAGDCTTAALAAMLAEPRPLADAARFAMAAASLAVSRRGGLAGMPTREEVEARLAQA